MSNNYNDIYFFPHGRFQKDYHISYDNIVGDFDGMATHKNMIVFFQCKTNRRALKKTLREYLALESIFGIEVIWFNAIDRIGLQINNFPAKEYDIERYNNITNLPITNGAE